MNTETLLLDIGTTTLEMALAQGGKITKTLSAPNPQCRFGADVFSRIAFCERLGTKALMQPLLNAVDEMSASLSGDNTPVFVAGNTVMTHIFLGKSPAGLGKYPYTPAYIGSVRHGRFTVLPFASAFIGADAVCGIACTGLDRTEDTEILLDLGTNCEMALCRGGRLLCTSAAAGPALEGAGIECGMSASDGAVTSAVDNGRELVLTSSGKPKGLAATGLIDIISALLRRGLISSDGHFTRGRLPLGARLDEAVGRLYITDEIYISQRDILSFLSAKSAVYSGISALLRKSGADISSVSRLHLSGLLGEHLNVENAALCSLLPSSLANKAVSDGNTALKGALILSSDSARAEDICRRGECFLLSEDELFSGEYIRGLGF